MFSFSHLIGHNWGRTGCHAHGHSRGDETCCFRWQPPCGGGGLPVILATIDEAGYQVSYRLYDVADFGVPQHRRRVIFFLSRDGETIEPMVQTHGGEGQPRHATLRDAVAHLQGTAMEVQPLTPALLQYMQYIPAGGNWRSIPLEHQPPWLLERDEDQHRLVSSLCLG